MIVAVRKGDGAFLGWFGMEARVGGCTLVYTSENCPQAFQSNGGILHSAYKSCKLCNKSTNSSAKTLFSFLESFCASDAVAGLGLGVHLSPGAASFGVVSFFAHTDSQF